MQKILILLVSLCFGLVVTFWVLHIGAEMGVLRLYVFSSICKLEKCFLCYLTVSLSSNIIAIIQIFKDEGTKVTEVIQLSTRES